nr:hypothetical protein [Tanacetum cinerariifolium]
MIDTLLTNKPTIDPVHYPLVLVNRTLDYEPSYLKGKPKAVMLFREDDLEEEIKEEFEEEEEEDGLEYFNTFLTGEELKYHEYLLKNPRPSRIRAK